MSATYHHFHWLIANSVCLLFSDEQGQQVFCETAACWMKNVDQINKNVAKQLTKKNAKKKKKRCLLHDKLNFINC